jgi:hypothetical protein
MGLINAKDADNLPVMIFGIENEANFYLIVQSCKEKQFTI